MWLCSGIETFPVNFAILQFFCRVSALWLLLCLAHLFLPQLPLVPLWGSSLISNSFVIIHLLVNIPFQFASSPNIIVSVLMLHRPWRDSVWIQWCILHHIVFFFFFFCVIFGHIFFYPYFLRFFMGGQNFNLFYYMSPFPFSFMPF